MSDGPDKPFKQRAPRRQSNRVRVEDVAAVAGVSGATVSRAINQAGPVSPKLRERIEEQSPNSAMSRMELLGHWLRTAQGPSA